MKKWILPVCLALLLALHAHLVRDALKKTPGALTVSVSTSLTAKTVPAAGLSAADPPIAPFIREKSRVGAAEAIVTYTTPEYARLAAVPMKYGSFLGSGGDRAVISDMLAKDLFLTDDVLGFTVMVGERSYVIGGVYWLDRSTAGKLTQSVYSEVYLPLGQVGNQNDTLSEFAIGMEGGSVINTLAKAEKVLNVPFEGTVVENYYEDRALIAQSQKVVWLYLAVVLAVILGIKCIRRIGALLRKARREGMAQKADILKAAAFAGILGLSIVLIYVRSFDLVLPQSYQTFQGSLGAYIVHCVQTANAHADDSLYNYVYHVRMILWVIGAAILAAAPPAIYRIVCFCLSLPARIQRRIAQSSNQP